jgi:hypothetical protein
MSTRDEAKWRFNGGVATWDGPIHKTVAMGDGMISVRGHIPGESFDMTYFVPAEVVFKLLELHGYKVTQEETEGHEDSLERKGVP